jgi:hypothetical protein
MESRTFSADLNVKLFTSRTRMFPFYWHFFGLLTIMMNPSFIHRSQTVQLFSNWLQIDLDVVILHSLLITFRPLGVHFADNFLIPNSLLIIRKTRSYEIWIHIHRSSQIIPWTTSTLSVVNAEIGFPLSAHFKKLLSILDAATQFFMVKQEEHWSDNVVKMSSKFLCRIPLLKIAA